jgi:hypothetical protein
MQCHLRDTVDTGEREDGKVPRRTELARNFRPFHDPHF